jgi:hypothetical protein
LFTISAVARALLFTISAVAGALLFTKSYFVNKAAAEQNVFYLRG